MIAYLKGIVAFRGMASAILEVGGVGYEVLMSQNGLEKLPEVGDSVRVLTYLQVRDDGMSLYGFYSEEEREAFLKLIGISGVGPKVALSALSSLTPAALAEAVANQDVSRVQKVPGIGKKTAQRIILELKGSFEQGDTLFDEAGRGAASSRGAHVLATEDLLAMGFTSSEAELALRDAPAEASEAALVQYALKRLGSM